MNRLFLIICLIACLTACKTPEKINYIQDVEPGVTQPIESRQSIIIQPKDMLSIIVSTKDPELAAMFNMSVQANRAGVPVESYKNNQYLSGYVVDNNGDIDFPVLGKIHAAGLSRWALQEKIAHELTERNLLKDMVVTIEFMNFKVSVLGEVKNPGTYSIEGDKVTVLEAIAMAGDLTIYGLRDEVYVIREENGERQNFKLDLRSKEIFNSPAYYLRQNDIIYVQPNEVRAGQSTINQNSVRSISLWLSITSLLTSISILVVNLVKK